MNHHHHHFLLISCAGQGHINPTLLLAKQLARVGTLVTYATTVRGRRRIKTLPSFDNLSYATFSDGSDDGPKPTDDPHQIMAQFKRVGAQSLTTLIQTLSNERRPVTFLIYTVLLPWAADVARNFHIPSAFLCIQSATTFAIYHRYFNCHNGIYYSNDYNNPSISIDLPGLPSLTSQDIPSFLLPTSPHASVVPTFQEHIQALEHDPNQCILVNTFDALEAEAIRTVGNMNVITIGPLIPSAFSDKKDPSDKSFGGDLFNSSGDSYLQWLNSKPDSSVIYVSFGSMEVLQKSQMEEILHGLLEIHRPFLWVLQLPENGKTEVENMIKNSTLNEEEKGLILPWCSQVEVLSHPSVGCFVMHCGWNSTMESMVAGVPVVVCPQYSDQLTNAKMVEEVWGNGVRGKVNEEGVVEREEIKRCVEMVMEGGERGEEMRENAKKWKRLALEAVKEGGSSNNNLKIFLETLGC